jgi:hypothetical protein
MSLLRSRLSHSGRRAVAINPIESAFLAGAAAALRRRVARHARLTARRTTADERVAVIRTGEVVLADRLSLALADEFESEAAQ